jgi:glycosyltransferase involved in cell wall biosynthesis
MQQNSPMNTMTFFWRKYMRKHRNGLLVLALFVVSWMLLNGCSKKEKQSVAKSDHKTICLNMIVKNESAVITRSLASALPMIDYWVIVDTGSTDGTQQIIKDFMKENGVAGELYERPWVNFGHNRNEALGLAKNKADYVLFLDADDYLSYDPAFKLPPLDKDYYYFPIEFSGTSYSRIFLVNNHQEWKWVGVLHEVLDPQASYTSSTMQNVVNVVTTEGARSKDPKKYEKDAAVLEAALQDNPDDTRNVFYLAQSYANAGNAPKAIEVYERRVALGGWQEEVFISLLQIAKLKEELKMSPSSIVEAYNRACAYRGLRIEPYYYLSSFYRSQSEFDKAYKIAAMGMMLPKSNDMLFVEKWMYDYGMLLEFSVSAYWCGKYQDSQKASSTILKNDAIPADIRELVERNLGFANSKLLEEITAQV